MFAGMFKRLAISSVTCLCFFMIPHIAFSQSHFLHFTTLDGLPTNKIYCATQDASGFIWFGTDNGLVRYNGSDFKTFTVRDGLPDNDIFSVFEDAQNRLWISGFKQAPCYFYKNKLYTTANDSFLSRYFRNVDMFRFTINAHRKRILFHVIYAGELVLLEYGQAPIKDYRGGSPLIMLQAPPIKLFSTEKGDYLVGYDMFRGVRRKTPPKTIPFLVYTMAQFKCRGVETGFFYAYEEKKIIVFRIQDDSFHVLRSMPFSLCSGPYTSPSSGLIFVKENGDVYSLDTATLDFVRDAHDAPDARVSTAFIDNKGNKWLCTHDNGVFVFPKYGAEIISSKKGPTSLAWDDTNKKFMAGYESFSLLSFGKGQKPHDIKIPYLINRSPRVTGLLYKNGYVYIGNDIEFIRYHVQGKTFKTYSGKWFRAIATIKDLEYGRNGLIMIGGANGAAYFSPDSEKITDKIWITRTTAICDVMGRGVFLGTVNGLYFRADGSRDVRLFKTGSHLDRARITDIKSDTSGRIWVGTSQYGLYVLDKGHLRHFDDSMSQQGFITSYYVKQIYIDGAGVAWIATDKGINRIEIDRHGKAQVKRITTSFGLPNDNISTLLVQGDTIYMTSLDGIVKFRYDPAGLTEIPGIEITGLWVNGKREELTESQAFSHLENNLVIEYAAIAFRSARNIEFQYKFVNAGKNWTSTVNNRIELPGLAPGKYRLQIRAVNMITGEQSETRQLDFRIRLAWYQSWWFIMAVVLFIVLLVTFLVRRRIYHIRQRSEERTQMNKQLAELEMQSLRAQMNPHFIFNSLTAIQNYFVLNREEKANAYMSKFAMLIRQMLEYSRDNFIPLDEEISLIENYMLLEKMRFEPRLDFILSVDPGIDPSEYVLPTLLLQPVLENAVNHGIMPSSRHGIIRLSIDIEKECLVINILDNGVGINWSVKNKVKPKGHQSRGMNILSKRIESVNYLHNTQVTYQVEDQSLSAEKISGTRISIRFPLDLVSKTIAS
jgi:signal transduction histidine kinase